jgi:photosystem II stability/assembly factor-like uncharacterized protein
MHRFSTAILLTATLFCSCNKNPDTTANETTFNTIDKTTLSIDGWEISKSVYDFSINSRDVFFVNSDIGFVVGYNGDIYKTTDSGESWTKQNSGTTLHLHSVFFLNENIGFASGQTMNCLDADCNKGSIFLRTINGGETWTKTFFPDYTRISSLKFFDDLKGIALVQTQDLLLSGDKKIAVTTDGGVSWNLIVLPVKPTYDRLFFTGNLVFVAGENRKIFKSSDYGYNWVTINTPVASNYSIRNLYFMDEKTGIIDGVTDVYKTTDGGSNWTKTNYPFTNFGTLHFYNENEGFNIQNISAYEGGDFPVFKGSISFRTKDGGASWSRSDLIESLHLGLTYFPQRELGFGFNGSDFYSIKKIE